MITHAFVLALMVGHPSDPTGAQAPAAEQPVLQAMTFLYTQMKGFILQSAERMPKEKYAYRITSDYRLLVSQRVYGSEGLEHWLLKHHGSIVRRPQTDDYTLRPQFAQWHEKQVFRGPARTAA